jgi:hypothetical protein
VTRLLLEVTNLETRETKYITVGGEAEVPDLIAGYALRYAQALLGLPAEVVPHSIAMWPGGDEEDDAA